MKESSTVALSPFASLMVGGLKLYRVCLSPLLGGNCRFHPSCSVYAEEAVRAHGAARGAWLAVKRLARCTPLNGGGVDPVPEYRR